MKILKKNQIIIYAFVLMLMVAGYFNYTENVNKTSLETSIQIQSKSDEQLADIGDAVLVSSLNENKVEEQLQGQMQEQTQIEEVMQTSAQVSEYFVKSKLERETMYSSMIETYENVLENPSSSETQKQSVIEEITKINNLKNKIMICENLLGTKGFEEVVVFVNDMNVNVVVQSADLQQQEVAQIQNIIAREMGVEINNIHISSKE